MTTTQNKVRDTTHRMARHSKVCAYVLWLAEDGGDWSRSRDSPRMVRFARMAEHCNEFAYVPVKAKDQCTSQGLYHAAGPWEIATRIHAYIHTRKHTYVHTNIHVSESVWERSFLGRQASKERGSACSLWMLMTWHSMCLTLYVCARNWCVQSWMTIKKTEISAQHKFLKPIYLCVRRGILLMYLDVHQKC